MAQNTKHIIIVVPGLDDGPDTWLMRLILRLWRSDGIKVELCRMQWRNGHSFQSKLDTLLGLIDEHTKTGYAVSLVGISAGGSAVINALFARPDKVHKVINICGRLRGGNNHGFRSLERRSRSSTAFRDSVLTCEQNLEKIDSTYLSRIMTFRARFGDELVPSDTSQVSGAYNVALPTIEHMISIATTLIFYRRCIIDFAKSS